jgi:hypothetical protein
MVSSKIFSSLSNTVVHCGALAIQSGVERNLFHNNKIIETNTAQMLVYTPWDSHRSEAEDNAARYGFLKSML